MTVTLQHKGSLITYLAEPAASQESCLGYLVDFKDKGVFDASLGRVDVTPAEAEAHNRALDEAMLQGLDDACQVGQGSHFYVSRPRADRQHYVVKTFTGTLVSADTSTTLKPRCRRAVYLITMRRQGRVFEGAYRPDKGDACFFKRVA